MTSDMEPSSVDAIAASFDTASDDQVLAAIEALPQLADEADARWASDAYYRSTAWPYLALADVAAKRRLRPAVRPLLQRASYGDPGELMRSLRHVFEAIFKPDWPALADEYLALARAERLGTRMWAIDCLVVIDDLRAVPVFEASLREDPPDIRASAEIGLRRLLHPEEVAAEAAAREAERARVQQERLDRQAAADARITDRRCAVCGKPLPSYRRTCKHCGAPTVA